MQDAPAPLPEPAVPPHENPPVVAPPVETLTEPLSPVSATERIATLDVLRGFALLGIFMVNMQFFAMPFMKAVWDARLAEAPASDVWSWAIVKVFFEFKFVTLFSLLFGIGFAVQLMRAQARGGNFAGFYLKRLAVLFCIGLLHALVLWYGDILLVYSVIALALLITKSFSPKALLGSAAAVFLFTLVLVGSQVALQVLFVQFERGGPSPAMVSTETAHAGEARQDAFNVDDNFVAEGTERTVTPDDAEPRLRFADVWRTGDLDPNSPRWIAAETAAFKHGPASEAFIFRSISFLYALIFTAFGFGWHILAMFLLGAALMKWDFFSSRCANWHRLFAFGLLPIGLAIEAGGAYLTWSHEFEMGYYMVTTTLAHEFGSVAMALGYVGVWSLIVHAGLLQWLTAALAKLGRMALTNYLMQTLVATFVMYWWGLGWFGDVSRPQQIMLVLGIYVSQIILSMIWLSVFRMGPMEWLWRSLSYGRVQPVWKSRQTGS